MLWRDPEAYKRPWGEWADEWQSARQVEATTARADAIRRRKHLDPRWRDVPIGSITRHDVKAWAVQLRGEVGPATVQRIVHLFSASLNAAMDAEVIQANPASRIRLPKGAQEQERFLTHDEYTTIRAGLPTTRDQLVTDLLVHTGLRWSELAGLHWARVDLSRGVLSVVEVYDEQPGAIKPLPEGEEGADRAADRRPGRGSDRVARRDRAAGGRAASSTRPESAGRGWCSPRRPGGRCATATGPGAGVPQCSRLASVTCGSTTCGTPTPRGCCSRASRCRGG